ncbi:hypothetical protein A1O7_09309 [Cladophialophora yegresii CBS 114405]|uniref:Zn(2)-C6 fungal-type domain-containing protein n=1 Tax=Cladophialophora yegresii CBS 114405 TaxID=1182544 RepID=W9VEC5_9EURO|nr:uncharacterized protein A1O7_09309 [Cladophialophora yegresii CBS 114405]EXJ53972.1 hypothetical protein A1O7_09309 [Cladophialophora yegresii CBS 114405]
MSDFFSLTHKFRASIDGQPAGVDGKSRRRNRQPLSCAPCRLKKLRCDRGHPCETCVKRGNQASCSYGKLASAKASDTAARSATRGRAQERLGRLEQLVMQMVDTSTSNGSKPSHSNESDTGASTDSSRDNDATALRTGIAKDGHLQYGSAESRYVGSTHWSAILESLQELKSALGGTTDGGDQAAGAELDEADEVELQDTDSLFGPTSHVSIAQILAQALPPRLQVDRRLSTYFNSRYLVIPLIHTQQFQRQYEQFWRTPLETPPLWISILFSICCLSAGLSEAVGSGPTTPEDQPSPRVSFLHAACQCLQLGGFTRPKRYVVEALGLYAQCKYMSTLDPSGEVGLIFSLAVRLAYRSGYHRDPSQFPHISVFEGEMRRRTWAMCRQFDLMVSFQLGLPSQIPPNSWDTRNPRNLLDTDFDEDTKVPPPSRPETEATQLLYFIVKARLMTTFGKVCAHALSFGATENYAQQVMDLDREVRATYATVPKVLHVKPMSQSFADPSYLTMVRTNCEFLYQKSLLVLHRKCMTQGTHPASTQACTDAAIAITRHMLDLHKEFKPGGQLFNDRWMLSSFTMNDFYLAGMVLCLEVSMWKKANPAIDIHADEKMREQYIMLKDSFAICEELSATSTEARRVAAVLHQVLGEEASSTGGSSGPSTGTGTSTSTSISTSAGRPSNPFAQPGKFMPSAMFPMQYDFSLASASPTVPNGSQGRGQGHPLRENLSNSSDTMDATFLPGITRAAGVADSFQNLMPGINNPVPLGGNSFLSFFSFSPASYAGGSGHGMSNASATASDPQTFDATPSMDIDWPLLDQWMALPNMVDMLPFHDGTGAVTQAFAGSSGMFQNQHQDQRPRSENENLNGTSNRNGTRNWDETDNKTETDPAALDTDTAYPPLADAQTMTTNGEGRPATDTDTEWTSTPYPFLGHESEASTTRHDGTGPPTASTSTSGSLSVSSGSDHGRGHGRDETGVTGPRALPLDLRLWSRRHGAGRTQAQTHRGGGYPMY